MADRGVVHGKLQYFLEVGTLVGLDGPYLWFFLGFRPYSGEYKYVLITHTLRGLRFYRDALI